MSLIWTLSGSLSSNTRYAFSNISLLTRGNTWFLSDSSLSFSLLNDSCWAGEELVRSLSWVTSVLFIRSTSLVYSSSPRCLELDCLSSLGGVGGRGRATLKGLGVTTLHTFLCVPGLLVFLCNIGLLCFF